MKHLPLLALLFVAQIFTAQANRFVYEVRMRPDSTAKKDMKTENAYLDVTAGKSMFYSEKMLQRDSLFARMRQTGGASFDRSQMENLRSAMEYTVNKDLSTGTVNLSSRIGRDQYSYDEDRKMEWKILPETAQIGEYKAQKAETAFGGRNWTAWFTTEIPFQDGPYKFSGLPGLIVKVEDEAGDYSFDLKETKNIAGFPEINTRGNISKVKRKDFEKQQNAFRKDPVSFMQASMGGGRGGFGPRGNGGGDNADRRKQMEERMKEEIAKSNNPIEK